MSIHYRKGLLELNNLWMTNLPNTLFRSASKAMRKFGEFKKSNGKLCFTEQMENQFPVSCNISLSRLMQASNTSFQILMMYLLFVIFRLVN